MTFLKALYRAPWFAPVIQWSIVPSMVRAWYSLWVYRPFRKTQWPRWLEEPSTYFRRHYCVTMTTSPSRILHLGESLALLSRHVDEIQINVPYQFRNIDFYEETAIQKVQQWARVFVQPRDTGPSMKLIPTLQRYLESQSCTRKPCVFVVIDDDVLVEPAAFSKADEAIAQDPYAIYSGRVQKFPENEALDYVLGVNVLFVPCEVVTPEWVSTLIEMNGQDPCRRHDDVAFIMACHKHGIPFKTTEPYTVMKTPESYTQDALWFQEPHSLKDKACYKALSKL